MRLAIWSTTTPRQNSTHEELFRRQLDEIELAERIGIDQVWFYEHHLNPSAPVPSPNLLIAAAAQRTGRIRFASMVNILPFRNPLLVAEEAALLDNLTGGRLDMGIGRGLRPPEFDAFDVDQQRSREIFLEAFDVIRRVWADEEFEHRGRYWTVRKNGPLAPPLVQKPHPPFLVSAQSEDSLRWAAQYDIPFAQIDSVVEQARRDQALDREVQIAHGQAGAAALSDARDLCRRERSAGSGRGAALSAAILGIVEPLHAVHRRRSAPRQLRFLATASANAARDGFRPDRRERHGDPRQPGDGGGHDRAGRRTARADGARDDLQIGRYAI